RDGFLHQTNFLTRKVGVPIVLLAGAILSFPYAGGAATASAAGNKEQTTNNKQQATLSGRGLDRDGQPIQNATVSIQGTGKAVSTDQNGRLAVEADGGDVTLVVSCVGFEGTTYPDSGSTIDLVVRLESGNDLE